MTDLPIFRSRLILPLAILLGLSGCEFSHSEEENDHITSVPISKNSSTAAFAKNPGSIEPENNATGSNAPSSLSPEITPDSPPPDESEEISTLSLLSISSEPSSIELSEESEPEVEITTPPPISLLDEDPNQLTGSSDFTDPEAYQVSIDTFPTRKTTRTIHYNEIDQSRLRRTELAYLIGDDKPYTGLAFKTHPDGTRSFEIDYVNGSAEGVLTQYYPNGNPSFQVPMKNNQANGVSTGWYEDQTRKSEYPYKNGVVHGVIKEWFPTGQLGFEATYVEGKITGSLKGWHLNGDEYTLGTVEPTGAQRFTAYYGPGRRWKETGWRNGKLWGYSYEWTPDGKLRSLKRFVDGKLMKVIK